MRQALGLIETVGLAAAIEAADTAIKSANVTLIGYEMTRGDGMITIKLAGDVGAVKAAVTAGMMAASRVNEVYSYHVIPRPHGEIDPLISHIDRGPGRGGPPPEEVPLGSDGGDGDETPPTEEEPEQAEPEAAVGTEAAEAAELPEQGAGETKAAAEEPASTEEAVAARAEGTPDAGAASPVAEEVPPTTESDLAPTAPPQRCEAITQAGARCRNRAQPGSDFCHIHAGTAATMDEEE